jgi:hypothetical protein
MLNLYFGNIRNAILSGDSYFEARVSNSIVESELGKKIIKYIDKGEVISKDNIIIPVIGSVSPNRLSGGTKSLLSLLDNPDLILDLACMGDNCFFMLYELVNYYSNTDICVCSDSYRPLYENGYKGNIFVKNSEKIVTSASELYDEWGRLL